VAPLLSAIIPSYNYARFVVRAVESCLAQTLADIEVVVVDDASTDESPALLAERFAKDPRVKLELAKENRGISGNFNRGLRAASGRFVGFCCADDEWLPEHAATLASVLESSGAVLAYAKARVVSADGGPVAPGPGHAFSGCPDGEFFERLVTSPNLIPFVATVFDREAALAVGGFDEKLRVLQDYALWFQLARSRAVRFVDRETVLVRWHGENASSGGDGRGADRKSEQLKRDAVRVFEDLLARDEPLLRERGLDRVARRRLADALRRLASRTTLARRGALVRPPRDLAPAALAFELPRLRARPRAGALRMNGNSRRLRFKLLAACTASAFALAVGEGVVRLVHRDEPGQLQGGLMDDVFRGVRLHSRGPVHVNSLGFRDDEDFSEVKPAGEKRVLFVGDSFLYGATLRLDELLPKRCEKRLPGVHAIDLAWPGWGPRHEVAAWRRWGVSVQPDVVVLCVFVGNDVMESPEDVEFFMGPDGELAVVSKVARPHMRFLRCSKLFRLWETTAIYQYVAHKDRGNPVEESDAEFVERLYWKVERLRLEQWRKGAGERRVLADAWRIAETSLRTFVAEVRASGARPLVVLIPDEVQVDARKRSELCRRFALDEKNYDLEQPQRRLGALAGQLSVPCVDVLAAFRERGSSGGLYRDVDTHWNAAGHELAASLVAPAIERLLR